MDDDRPVLSIGEVAARTGLPVRTIRFWSDIGVVAPAARTSSGRRVYDAGCLARLEMVATLRDLGLGLAEIRRIAEKQVGVAEVAAIHAEALAAQIRTLRLRRAVLSIVAKRASSSEEMTLMNKLARLSAAERKQIINDFVTEVFEDLEPDPTLAAHLRRAPDLPDDPSPEQVDAWVELAELVADPGFRQRVRTMAEFSASVRTGQEPGNVGRHTPEFVHGVLTHVGAAREQGIAPESAGAAAVVEAVLAGTPDSQDRARLLAELRAGTDARAERYWQLAGIINGWPPFPEHVPAFEWLIAALRAHS